MRQGSQISSYLYDLCVWQFFFLRFIRSMRRCSYIHKHIFFHSLSINSVNLRVTNTLWLRIHQHTFWWVVRWCIFIERVFIMHTLCFDTMLMIFVKESSLCELQFSQYVQAYTSIQIRQSCIPLAGGICINKEIKNWMIFWRKLHTKRERENRMRKIEKNGIESHLNGCHGSSSSIE